MRLPDLTRLRALALLVATSCGEGGASNDTASSTGAGSETTLDPPPATSSSTSIDGLTSSTSSSTDAETATSPTTSSTDTSGLATSTDTSGPTATTFQTDTATTDTPGLCDGVHVGDLLIEEDTDLEPLASLGRVTGNVYVRMQGRDQPDLSFFGCLHTIDGSLIIKNNVFLASTAGMADLQSVQRIWVYENQGLQTVSGFDGVVELFELRIYGNPMLEKILFDTLTTAATMTLGFCVGDMGAAQEPLLLDLAGFSGLTKVGSITIEGHESLVTAEVLDALAANGAPDPLAGATVRFNVLLPEADVHAQLDTLGLSMQQRDVCGNAEGDPECFCVVG